MNMAMAVKIMGAIDILAAIILLAGNYWIGVTILAVVLLIKGLISLFS
jgi:hypothetical protein